MMNLFVQYLNTIASVITRSKRHPATTAAPPSHNRSA
jgi:hypothetical protein